MANRQTTLAPAAGAPPLIVFNSQAGRQASTQVASNLQTGSQASPQVTVRQASQADSTLSQAESTISQAVNPLASPTNSALSQSESSVSQAGNPLAYPANSNLSQTESEVSQEFNPQAAPAVRCSARLRTSQPSQNNNVGRQVAHPWETVLSLSQIVRPPSQASASQVTSSASPWEARPSPSQ